MPEDWSRAEVEAAVADYLVMLRFERAGIPFNKSEHRRALSQLLRNRTDGSIERKHQNISAVLLALRIPYIKGYKPLSNFQQLLFDVVSAQVDGAVDLLATLELEANAPAQIPSFDDILSTLVPVPVPAGGPRVSYYDRVRAGPRIRRGVDYLAMDASNRSLGDAGEEYVVRFEQARLVAAREDRLASNVRRISSTIGDGAGFDVLSFDSESRERIIEVKTTAYGPATPFFVTRNEVAVSRERAHEYFVYRVFDFRRRARLFQVRGQIDGAFSLEPVQYLANLRDV